MKKVKVKKLTKHQKIVLQMQTRIYQYAHDLRYKNNEIEMLKRKVKSTNEARNQLDTKLHETRTHVTAALNYVRSVKIGLQKEEVYQVVGKVQGRLEAAQGYDRYGAIVNTVASTIGRF